MTAGELEVALAKIDINRHEAMDMLGSLGKSILLYREDCIFDSSADIAWSLFLVIKLSHVLYVFTVQGLFAPRYFLERLKDGTIHMCLTSVSGYRPLIKCELRNCEWVFCELKCELERDWSAIFRTTRSLPSANAIAHSTYLRIGNKTCILAHTTRVYA